MERLHEASPFVFIYNLYSPFPEEVQHFEDFLLRGTLVDADVTDIAKKREVDDARRVLLVVGHVGVKFFVIIAGDGERAVVLLDETNRLTHLVSWEARFGAGEVELAN